LPLDPEAALPHKPETALPPNLEAALPLNPEAALPLTQPGTRIATRPGSPTTATSGGTAKRHAPHCPPKTAVSTPLHLPLSTRLDEISIRGHSNSRGTRPKGLMKSRRRSQHGCPCSLGLRRTKLLKKLNAVGRGLSKASETEEGAACGMG
jgi:hypothetical protein